MVRKLDLRGGVNKDCLSNLDAMLMYLLSSKSVLHCFSQVFGVFIVVFIKADLRSKWCCIVIWRRIAIHVGRCTGQPVEFCFLWCLAPEGRIRWMVSYLSSDKSKCCCHTDAVYHTCPNAFGAPQRNEVIRNLTYISTPQLVHTHEDGSSFCWFYQFHGTNSIVKDFLTVCGLFQINKYRYFVWNCPVVNGNYPNMCYCVLIGGDRRCDLEGLDVCDYDLLAAFGSASKRRYLSMAPDFSSSYAWISWFFRCAWPSFFLGRQRSIPFCPVYVISQVGAGNISDALWHHALDVFLFEQLVLGNERGRIHWFVKRLVPMIEKCRQ